MTSRTELVGDLNRTVALRSHLETLETEDGRILVISEDAVRLLSGPLFHRLLPMLDGRRTIAEVVSALDKAFPAQDVIHALAFLERHAYLDSASDAADTRHLAFWHSLGVTRHQASTHLDGRRVALIEAGHVHDGRSELVAALGGLGVETTTGDVSDDIDLSVVLADDYLRDELSAINDTALRSGRPWLLVKPVGRVIWLGPLLVPGESACWTCLAQRLRDNRRDELVARAASGQDGFAAQPVCDASIGAAASLASVQIATILASAEGRGLKSTLKSIDIGSLASQEHVVVRRPQCPSCGKPTPTGNGNPLPLRVSQLPPFPIASQPKERGSPTSDRTCSADETVRRLSHLVSPLTGVIPELVPQTEEGAGHVFTCKQITPWRAESPVAHLDSAVGASGRGETEAEAKAACMAEAIERYCTTFNGTENLLSRKYVDVADDAIHPNCLLGFSQRQYATRRPDAPMNADWVPEPFDDNEVVDWVPAWSVTSARHRLIPARFCYYDAPRQGSVFCLADSNGCAAGNVIEEAIVQGLYELIERDAMAIWWSNRLPRPPVDLSTMTPEVSLRIRSMRAALSSKGRSLEVLDLTNDIGVPVVATVSWQRHDGQGIAIGCASHLDRSVAVIKALGELGQRSTGPNDNNAGQAHAAVVESYLAAHNDAPGPPEPAPTLSDDLRDDIKTLVARLKLRGIEVLVVDMTQPDIDFPTVRVVAPGLRHHRNRLAPGRLYDVPVALGWLASAHDETALNPLPCPV